MFTALGRTVYVRRRLILALTAIFVVIAVVWGTGVFGALANGGFEDPDSESNRAAELAADTIGSGSPDVIALFRSAELTVDDAALRTAVEGTLADLPGDAVRDTTTYWSSQSPTLVSTDRHATYAILQLTGRDDDAAEEAYEQVEPLLRDTPAGISVQLGGNRALFHDVNSTVEEDIQRAEMLSMPLVLLLLVIVFGGLVAASLPLAIGGLAILGAFTAVRLLTEVTDVSIFAINIITLMGLGLAIDYALFIVSRFREELRGGRDVPAALAVTMRTAGRTIAFSGLTVAVSLASLLFFPQMFLRSMSLGGIAAVLVAMIAALTVLPALLAVLGRRVDALRIPMPWRRTGSDLSTGSPAWHRIARVVMRRPVAFVAVIVPLLLLVGSPFLRIEFGGVDERSLPSGTESRVVAETLERDFPAAQLPNVEALVTAPGALDEAALGSYVAAIRQVEGVRGADVTALAASPAGSTARVSVSTDGEEISDEAQAALADVRDIPPPAGTQALVGGRTGVLADQLSALGGSLPLMAIWAGLATLLLLFFAFGSVVLPVKAILMNILSLSATFGAIVWIFQDGHLAEWLGFTVTGAIESSMPVLIFAIAFGLSMDYEVFLLSRIREQWDLTGDNQAAVATGLERTGRIISSAAIVLAIVIGAFSTSGIVFIKMIGVGILIAVLLDATVIRGLLVPATMRLLGRANWWAPGPLARLGSRVGFRESGLPVTTPITGLASGQQRPSPGRPGWASRGGRRSLRRTRAARR